jgi:hypothetical protein
MKTVIKSMLVALFLFANAVGIAQNENPLTNPGSDPGSAPASTINNYIIPMLLAVIICGYKMLVNKEKRSI